MVRKGEGGEGEAGNKKRNGYHEAKVNAHLANALVNRRVRRQ